MVQITESDVKAFERYLKSRDFADYTITNYSWTVNYYRMHYEILNANNVIRYKAYLMEHFKPSTVNLRLRAINSFCEFKKERGITIKYVKCQKKPFVDHIISNADYKYLKMRLKRAKNYKWYYLIWFIGATGCRVSEVINVKVAHVYDGYMDMYCKGEKLRRIYIPKHLQKELIAYIEKENLEKDGWLFLNKNNEKLNISGVERMCKIFAKEYDLDPKDIYPHSFRHRFAINFLESSGNDIMMLSDLLGHSSVQTTQLYTRQDSKTIQKKVDKCVTW